MCISRSSSSPAFRSLSRLTSTSRPSRRSMTSRYSSQSASKPASVEVRAVVKGGLSRHQAAAQFGVAISTAINWVRRFRETGGVEPDQVGGYRPKKIAGPHRDWLLQRCRKADFTLRGLVAELAERGLKVDYRTVWEFVHAEKLSHKKRR